MKMSNLTKIRDVSGKYDVTARTLRYYEAMGLLTSTRNEDAAYRMYDENAVKRLEQILILRKLNISIKDIQRIFNADRSDVVLEVLGKKVQNIDDEVALLHELKNIVQDFIREIEKINFSDNSDIKLLYDKAKDIETQFVSVDYIGKPSNINRLIEITDKLDKKIPDVMIVRIPQFRAATTGYHTWDDMFKEGGGMNQLWQHSQHYTPVIFDCVDFMIRIDSYGAEWLCAVNDNVTEADVAPLNLINFAGGLYAMAVCIDDDDDSLHKVEEKILKWLESTNFVHDESRGVMGHMTYCDDEVKKGLGYEQLQRYVPIKLKED
jgi:DNA-binding transcriptional MerR regulator